MRKNKRNRIILFILIGIVCLMAVGYAAFNTQLEIKGTSSISSKWDIRITNVKESNSYGDAKSIKEEWTDLTANMEANLYNKGDYIEYEVTIENNGDFDAKLSDIITNVKSSNEAVLITFSGYTKGQVLYKQTSQIIEVKIEYNPEYEGTGSGSGAAEVTFEYVQNEGGNITPTEDYLVTYDCTTNGGGDCSTYNEYVTVGESINLSHTATKTGYEFVGWNTDKDASEGLPELAMGTKDITLYAIFKDKVAPEVILSIGDYTPGENEWYQALNINAEVSDNEGIKETLYCITTESTCTPSEELTLEGNLGTITLENNKDAGKVCVKAVDLAGNETNECSEAYKVDGEDPEISNMTITPDSDVKTIAITIEASDNHSGVYKYYYSKDAGRNYVESDNANYTFASLEDGDYLITAYVKDEAGNVSEIKAGSTTIRTPSFCEENGITDLGECIISTEAGK